ncbi:MAG: universal stress protein [Candidatus Eremiobacteraeota bacterium]|nr:universal stress protein [Candidatus Eremiobacteraeota bacterium]
MNEGAQEILGAAALSAARAEVPCTCAQLEGRPETAIVRFAVARNADAIVMGTQGKRGLERLLLGSTAEGVMRTASIPVVVVHGREDAAGQRRTGAKDTTAATVR